MNAPFKADLVKQILAEACVGISDLKKNPAAVIAAAREQQVAILNRNKPVAYLIAPHVWEHICEVFDDLKLAEEVEAGLAEEGDNFEVTFDDL